MNHKEIIQQAKEKTALLKKHLHLKKTRDVLGFLRAKKLLFLDFIPINHRPKLKITDVIWVGKHVEPRALEVLPAALLHYPSRFVNLEKMPKNLKIILAAIREGKECDVVFHGIPYSKMKHWADTTLPDKRTKPEKDKKQIKSFRLSKDSIKHLKERAASLGKSESAVLDEIIQMNANH